MDDGRFMPGKYIKIDKEYSIYTEGGPVRWRLLRHYCTEKGEWVRTGKESSSLQHCTSCRKKTPDKIWLIYKLWVFHNETGG